MSARGFKKVVFVVFASLIVGLGYSVYTYNNLTQPLDAGEARYMKLEGTTTRRVLLSQLTKIGVVRDAGMAEIYAKMNGAPAEFKRGTYLVKPGQTLDEVFKAMQEPVKQLVRLREGWWIARQAEILEKNSVCKASDYIELTRQPDEFRKEFEWLPKGIETLEGYLYPDTYNFPPETGAKEVIREQLGTFKNRLGDLVNDSAKLKEAITVASMVELEAAKDDERPRIAGVIMNRIKRRMNLEIDATVLYAVQKWFVLPPNYVRTVQSPYNTYLNPGLPPGPIGAPSAKSIEAALKPESHPFLFYVAKPDRHHFFAATYSEHIANIRKARALPAQ